MEEIIGKKLGDLKNISAREEFKRESFKLIMASPQNRSPVLKLNIFESITLGAAIVLASVLLIVVFNGGYSRESAITNSQGGFDLQIGEATYFDETARAAVALRLENLEQRIKFDRDLQTGARQELLKEVDELRALIK